MYSVPSGSFQRLSEPLALWQAWLRCRRGKRRRPDVARFDVDADRHVFALSQALRAGTWMPGPLVERDVLDPKPRTIVVAPVRDRVVHQAVIGEVGPILARSFVPQSHGCLQGRGPLRAALAALRGVRAFRWRLSLDIAAYFPSVPHDVLLALWWRRLRDADTRRLVETIVRRGGRDGRGMPIGSYFSHFSGALVLDGADHLLSRVLKVPCRLRYMDDFLLFDDDPSRLVHARDALAAWLRDERGLVLKDPAAIPASTTVPFDFVGQRVSRAGLEPAPKLWRRLPGRLRIAAERGPLALERTVAAYRGLAMAGIRVDKLPRC